MKKQKREEKLQQSLIKIEKVFKKGSIAFTMHKWTSRTKSRHAVSVLAIEGKKIVNVSEDIAYLSGLRYSKTRQAVLVWGATEEPGAFLIEQFVKFTKIKMNQEEI